MVSLFRVRPVELEDSGPRDLQPVSLTKLNTKLVWCLKKLQSSVQTRGSGEQRDLNVKRLFFFGVENINKMKAGDYNLEQTPRGLVMRSWTQHQHRRAEVKGQSQRVCLSPLVLK